MVSDFAVIIAIFSMTLLDVLMGINTPKLMVIYFAKKGGSSKLLCNFFRYHLNLSQLSQIEDG